MSRPLAPSPPLAAHLLRATAPALAGSDRLQTLVYVLRLLRGEVAAVPRAAAAQLRTAASWAVRRWRWVLAAALAWRLGRAALGLSAARAARARRRALRARLAAAESYAEYAAAAEALDAAEGRRAPAPWLGRAAAAALAERTARLRRLREAVAAAPAGPPATAAAHALVHALRADGARRLAPLLRAALEARARARRFAVPPPLAEHVAECVAALRAVCDAAALPLEERLAFVRELRHAHGRTALVFSGGGSFGHFSFGVIRELLAAGLLPRVVSGSSAGAIAAAMVATRTDAELAATTAAWLRCRDSDFFGAPKSLAGLARSLWARGTLHDAHEFGERLARLFGDLTFAEAYQRSGRILNIAVTAADTREPPRLLNYLTAPHCVVRSAVAASSAFPFLFAPQELLAKDGAGRVAPYHVAGAGAGAPGAPGAPALRRWADGSLEEDLPMRGLSEQFGVNWFLVSQCNPYLVPVLAALAALPPRVARLAEAEAKHAGALALALRPRSRLLKLVCQPWSGDVNFVLPAMAFGNLLRSATNFSRREITRAMREGQRSVWARREAVRAGGAVEVAIDAALAELAGRAAAASRRDAAAAAAAAAGRRRGSLPSWMDLKSLGLPSSDSADELGGGRGSRGSLGAIAELAGPPPLRVHAEEGGGSSDGERSGAEEAEDGGDAAAAGDGGAATPRDGRPSWAVAAPESPLLEGGLEALRDLSAALEGGGTALDLISP